MAYLEIFAVAACPDTGEWLDKPMPTGERTEAADWLRHEDTEAEHFDTYEPVTNTGDPVGPTRALIVRWTRRPDGGQKPPINHAMAEARR